MKINLLTIFLLISGYLSAQMPNTLSKTEKVYGLSKFWQEVNYNFIYLDKVDREAWEMAYIELIEEVQQTQNDYEYFRLLQRFCALLQDGHTNVFFPKAINDQLYTTNFGAIRLELSNIEGKAIITRINVSKKDELPLGTEVVQVNGMPTTVYIAKFVEPYISSSTDYILENRGIQTLFKAPIGTSFDITFKLPNGERKEMKLTHEESPEEEAFPPFSDRSLLDFKWLDNEIAYIALNSFSFPNINKLFEKELPELYKAKGLIVDLRTNGGGNTSIGRKIMEYLTEDEELYGSRTHSRLHIPSYKAWGASKKAKDTINNSWAKQAYLSYRDQFYHNFDYRPSQVKLKKKRIIVPTALLIGNGTASAAEDFLIFADNQQHMTKIGEPTFGSTGQPFMFDLPGGASARICTKKDTYPDGREFVGVGIQPDILVARTLDDYLNNNDPALNKAVDYIKKQIR